MTTYDAPVPAAPGRTAASWTLVALTPLASWVAWVGTSGGYVSDARHVLWFVTVTVGVLVAGGLAPRDNGTLVAQSVLAVVSTIGTLYWWWSEDITGLFMVGIIIATPPVSVLAPVLLALGRLLPLRRDHG